MRFARCFRLAPSTPTGSAPLAPTLHIRLRYDAIYEARSTAAALMV